MIIPIKKVRVIKSKDIRKTCDSRVIVKILETERNDGAGHVKTLQGAKSEKILKQ